MPSFEERIEAIRKKIAAAPPIKASEKKGTKAAANDKDEDVDEDVLRILERH